MTPAQEAAAFWGSAENDAYPTHQRLACALKALEFYGQPHRGDVVEAWIKAHRDQHSGPHGATLEFQAIDWMLDDYRLHADTGTPLDEDVTDGPGEPPENGDPNG